MIAPAKRRSPSRVHPLTGQPRAVEAPRPELYELRAPRARGRRDVNATYDAARTTDEFKNYWANADALDADSANSKTVRAKLVQRSRYEVGNNGYVDGLVQTYATDLVGTGPLLRMQTDDAAFNDNVERAWWSWCKAIQFRRKLWCMAHAKLQDGEAFGIIRNNPRVRDKVKLDIALVETEQVQTPYLPFQKPGYVDGIRFDEFGNAIYYDVLPQHPGGQFAVFAQQPEQVPARFVLHWFMLRRPGQHRGIPELRSTLNVGAAFRRWREATIGAAETAAEFTVLLKAALGADDADAVSPMATLDIEKRMMTALPMGWDAGQMKAEHPGTSYAEFHKSLVSESARPKSMPYCKAACDSSSYNYASGRLDFQTYHGNLDCDREDANDVVLDHGFGVWWEEATLAYGWAADPDEPGDHQWDWPAHAVADIQTEATARDIDLRNGSESLTTSYTKRGRDFEEELPRLAAENGVTPDEMRAILRNARFNAQNQQSGMLGAETQAKLAAQPKPAGATANA